MQTSLTTILNLLIESPGNIIYHLVLAFSVISSLQAALITQRVRQDPNSRRLIFGLGMLLLGQAILYLSSGFAWQNVVDGRTLLPPLDRAVSLYSLVWIIWLWVFPKPARLGDLVTGFLNLGVVILFLFTYSSWGPENEPQTFNLTWFDQTWEIAALFLIIISLGILFFSRPIGWEFGVGMLSLFLVGNLAHLLLAPQDKDFSGYIRLAQLAAYPLLPTLLNRFVPSSEISAAGEASAPGATQIPFPRTQERRRYSADPRTVHAWLALYPLKEPEQILSATVQALAQTMLSDICFFISCPTHGQVALQIGYDLIREEAIPGITLDQSKVPVLATALQRGKNLSITEQDVQPPDLKAINAALGLKESSSLLFLTLPANEKAQRGILFLSPYSNRQWSADDQTFLSSQIEALASVLQRAFQPEELAAVPVETHPDLEQLRSDLELLRRDNQLLMMELIEYRTTEQKAPTKAADMDISALVALQQEAQEQINELQAENEHLQQALKTQSEHGASDGDLSSLEAELRSALKDIALLQNQLADANARNLLLEREIRQSSRRPDDNFEVITSVIQEIRQPLASINGYTEVLLSESAGIVGALQKKFLERILASTERLHSILNDVIRVTTLASEPLELSSQPVDLETIIDNAIADISAQLREKNIAMRVDLPEKIPQIYADRDAIQQIVLHLLQNAGTVTPQESAITLRARVQTGDENDDFLLLQVTDYGGGVRLEDLPRVFARHYRAEKPLIQGLGDTGVGLSIVKTLVEAHGGRVWVDSVLGQTTMFSVLLPIHPHLNNGNSAQ